RSIEHMFEKEGTGLPAGMESMVPGAELARVLAGVDRDRLSGFDRVELLKARSRLRSHVDAELLADMVGVLDAEMRLLGSDWEWGEIHDVAAAEIGAALSWTRRASERQLDFASTLLSDYPPVWQLLREGLLDLPRARVIVEHTLHLEPEVRDRVVEVASQRAPTQTTGLLAARIRRLAIWTAPGQAKKRYENGLEERLVASETNPDGTANLLGMHLSASDSQAAMRRINRLAQGARTPGDQRTMDQIRADVFLDLLRGRHQNRGRDPAVVDIQVDLTTLLELDDKPGEIPGWGPVISDIARQVVTEQDTSEWRYTITDQQGAVIGNGTTRRRPTTVQRRAIQARARTCVFPGCRMPAIDCDLDHNRPWADGGTTAENNLGPFCRHHHVIKHHGWTITQTDPGTYQLTSPLGHTYSSGQEPP
ncbi:MAG: DUF222 domain-containing protein, partial [Acidimicrobiia bacterium]